MHVSCITVLGLHTEHRGQQASHSRNACCCRLEAHNPGPGTSRVGSEAVRECPPPCPPPASGGCWPSLGSLACGGITPTSASMFTGLVRECVSKSPPFHKDISHIGLGPHWNVTVSAKTLLPDKLTFTGPGGEAAATLGEAIQPITSTCSEADTMPGSGVEGGVERASFLGALGRRQLKDGVQVTHTRLLLVHGRLELLG